MRWLREFPTTQALSFGALLLTVFVIVNWTVSAMWYNRPSPDGLGEVLVFLGTWLGVDTTRFWLKRRTEFTEPPKVMAADAAGPATAAIVATEGAG